MSTIEQLSTAFADQMKKAALRFLTEVNGIVTERVNLDLLSQCLKAETAEALGEGLKDARQALSANMASMAEVTFMASATLGGIRAGKKYMEVKA